MLTVSGCAALGFAEKQAQDELREVVQGLEVLLRQEHHTQDEREEIRLPVRL